MAASSSENLIDTDRPLLSGIISVEVPEISSPASYKYCKLPPRTKSIRVLDILPTSSSAPEADDEAINCGIRVIDLACNPRFTTLSYVWGKDPPTAQHTIVCDGYQIKVTSNCESALRHLRRKLGSVTIWVDAVCINQCDDIEKAHQLPLMADIYSGANFVYVWLGEGKPETDRAMAYIANNKFRQYFTGTEGNVGPHPWKAVWYMVGGAWNWSENPLPLRDGKTPWNKKAMYTTYSDLKLLLQTPWIGRLWTYQEIILATNPVLVCGNFHVPWETFTEGLLSLLGRSDLREVMTPWLSTAHSRSQLQSSMPTFSPNFPQQQETYRKFILAVYQNRSTIFNLLVVVWFGSFIGSVSSMTILIDRATIGSAIAFVINLILNAAIFYTIFFFDNNDRMRTVGHSLYQDITEERIFQHGLFSGLYSRQATNSVDMAYGMWAVLGHYHKTSLPEADYSASVGTVYRTFVFHWMKLFHSVDLILIAAARGIPGQPSWVPDLAASEQHEWNTIGNLNMVDDFGLALSIAEGEATRMIEFDDAHEVLKTYAYHVATITLCVKFKKTTFPFKESERDAHLENAKWFLWLRPQLLSTITRRSQMLNPGMWLDGVNSNQNHQVWNFTRKTVGKSPPQILSLLNGNGPEGKRHEKLFKQHIQDCNSRAESNTVFAAQYPDGTLFHGQCSLKAEVGDHIIRISGMVQPVLVRSRPGSEYNMRSPNNDVSIISPVHIFDTGRTCKYEDILNHHRKPVLLEEHYVKYNIH